MTESKENPALPAAAAARLFSLLGAKNIVISGDPVAGLAFHGPFQDSGAATGWAERDLRRENWWLGTLQPPDTHDDVQPTLIVTLHTNKEMVDVEIFLDREAAERRRTAVAKKRWKETFSDPPPPDDEIGDAYFEHVERENFEIFVAEVKTA